ncbi:Spy/CpxP family protein refolding chaperone [Stenoxybacter acetivorans]|uniref:Spy/CpxP family protein refolding chaperone n=1 Tax=Stenoxybacter acetivorans TaxID=422441 RepID=UPI00055B9168|nr:hypothetical protein [Stenoxybacter acetivorans]
MKSFRHVLLISAAALSFTSLTVQAAPPHGLLFLENINLSSSQKTQIQQIREQYRQSTEKRESAKNQQQQLSEQKDDLLKDKTFNEPKARTLVQAINQQRDAIELQRLKQEHAIFQVLTPQQQQTYFNQKQDMMKTAKRPLDQTAKQPLDQTAKQPLDQTAKQPLDQTAKQPLDQKVKATGEIKNQRNKTKKTNPIQQNN